MDFPGEHLKVNETANMPTLTTCTRCGYVSSQKICKACVLLEGLNKGLPRLGIGKTSRINRIMNKHKEEDKNSNSPCTQDNERCKSEDRKCLCPESQDIKPLQLDKISI